MLIEDINNIKSGKSELRKFGLTVGIVLGLLGGLLWWRGKDIHIYFLVISTLLIFFGLVFPSFLKPLQKVWMMMAVTIGWFMTRLLLSVLFFLIFTPVRMVAYLFGKDFLSRKVIKNSDSYWI